MKVLLINVDAPFNYAIRKLYRYHIERGDEAEMLDLGYKGYPHKKKKTIDGADYDEIHISNIFENNAYVVTVLNNSNVFYGGIGSRNPKNQLPKEIDDLEPWYFPDEDTAYGFITRGCIRNCYFCKVRQGEGYLHKYRNIEKIVGDFKKVVFLDNNILSYEHCIEQFNWLAEHKIKADFNQGLDYRLVTDENLEALTKVMNLNGSYIFAFDDIKYKESIEAKLPIIKRWIPQPWKVRFYVYIHPDMPLQDTIDRLKWCKEHECLPYVMRDYSCWSSPNRNF